LPLAGGILKSLLTEDGWNFLDVPCNSNRNCLEELFVSPQNINCIKSISIRYSSYIVSSVDTGWNVTMSVAID